MIGSEPLVVLRTDAKPVGAVDILHVALTQVFHQQRGAIGLFRREQQVHVIGHKHIGMHSAAKALGNFSQEVQIEAVVFVAEKANGAVIPSLDDMPGDAGEAETGSAGHGKDLERREVPEHIRKTWSVPYLLLLFMSRHLSLLRDWSRRPRARG